MTCVRTLSYNQNLDLVETHEYNLLLYMTMLFTLFPSFTQSKTWIKCDRNQCVGGRPNRCKYSSVVVVLLTILTRHLCRQFTRDMFEEPFTVLRYYDFAFNLLPSSQNPRILRFVLVRRLLFLKVLTKQVLIFLSKVVGSHLI